MNIEEGNSFYQWPQLYNIYKRTVDLSKNKEFKDRNKFYIDKAEMNIHMLDKAMPHLKEARSFIFPDDFSIKNTEMAPVPVGTLGSLDLPFKTCVFEMQSVQMKINSADPNHQHENLMNIDWLMVHELAPNQYCFGGYFYSGNKQTIADFLWIPIDDHRIAFSNIKIDEHFINLFRVCCNGFKLAAKIYCDFLNSPDTHVGQSHEHRSKIKIKTASGQKDFIKLKPIIVVKKKTAEFQESLSPRLKNIDWSHRWEVRGHWRKIEGLGKNREGLYQVKDFTWVKNHTKGPAEALLVQKTRRIQND